nr:MAG TPA: hypothetical protein [Caudoviricetes sp.]
MGQILVKESDALLYKTFKNVKKRKLKACYKILSIHLSRHF